MRNWKTTISGILALVMAGLNIAHNPASAADPTTIGTIVSGVGLILAKDSTVSGPPGTKSV